MKIRMDEHYQGTNQPTLKPGDERTDTEIGLSLCHWLVAHRKATDITPLPVETPEPAALDITPSALQLVSDYSLDVSWIVGTGANGRIIKSDVMRYLELETAAGGAVDASREAVENEDN